MTEGTREEMMQYQNELFIAFNAERVEPHLWKWIDCFNSFKLPPLLIRQLCHGMIPDVLSIIHQDFKKYRNMESFCQFANLILEDLASLGLSFLKIKTYLNWSGLLKTPWWSQGSCHICTGHIWWTTLWLALTLKVVPQKRQWSL